MKREVKRIKLGIERLLDEQLGLIRGKRVALVCNQASVDHSFRHAADLFHEHPDTNLTTLFGPQHGIRGDVQDNMVETTHATDRKTGLPIYSLYSETREPTEEMLRMTFRSSGWAWSGWPDSNRRPPRPKRGALAKLRYSPYLAECSGWAGLFAVRTGGGPPSVERRMGRRRRFRHYDPTRAGGILHGCRSHAAGAA